MTDMNAGRELDALVAEKAMGIAVRISGGNEYIGRFDYADEGEILYSNPESSMGWSRVPHYTTRIQDAWMVVNAMRAIGFSFEIGETTIFDDDGNHALEATNPREG